MTHAFVAQRSLNPGLITLLAVVLGGCSSDPSEPSDPVARGHQTVVEEQCETCHTPSHATSLTLSGADEPQPTSQAFPSNLTPDPETGIREWDDDTLVQAILTGVDDENEPLCPPMPRFADEGMSEAEARNIVAYLRSLDPVEHEVSESSCPPLK